MGIALAEYLLCSRNLLEHQRPAHFHILTENLYAEVGNRQKQQRPRQQRHHPITAIHTERNPLGDHHAPEESTDHHDDLKHIDTRYGHPAECPIRLTEQINPVIEHKILKHGDDRQCAG